MADDQIAAVPGPVTGIEGPLAPLYIAAGPESIIEGTDFLHDGGTGPEIRGRPELILVHIASDLECGADLVELDEVRSARFPHDELHGSGQNVRIPILESSTSDVQPIRIGKAVGIGERVKVALRDA